MIKQHHIVEYFGFCFGVFLSGESMAIKPFKKTDTNYTSYIDKISL